METITRKKLDMAMKRYKAVQIELEMANGRTTPRACKEGDRENAKRKRLVERHSYSKFQIFSVNTDQKINQPANSTN